MLLKESAYRELLLRQRIDEGAKAVMLAYAQGSDLEYLATLLKVAHLTAQAGDPEAISPIEPLYKSDMALREHAQKAFERLSTTLGP